MSINLYKPTILNKVNKSKTIAVTAMLLIVGVFFLRFVAPFGSIVQYQFNSASDKDKITRVNGIETVESFQPGTSGTLTFVQQIIRKNIATFQLKLLSSTLDGIWVKLRFKGNPKEIKVGVRGSTTERYLYAPVYNDTLQNLTWDQTTAENILFLQKEKTYSSLKEFIKNPPKDKAIATYFVDPTSLSMDTDKKISSSKFNTVLRGSHTMYVKVTKSPLLIELKKIDENLYKGEDILNIEIYKNNQKVAEKKIDDDGIIDNSQLKLTPQMNELTVNDVTPGVYKIILKDMSEGADVRIDSILVNQPGLVLASPVFPVDNKPSVFVTNSKTISVQTLHPVSTQSIRLDDKYDLTVEKATIKYAFNLDQPNFEATNTAKLHTLSIPKNDVIINGNGVFTDELSSYFNPFVVETIELIKLPNVEKVDFILARYTPITKNNDWMEAQIFIDPKNIKIDGDKLFVSLESPDLESYGGEINVDSLEITTTKPSWFGGTPNISSTASPWEAFIGWLQSFFKKVK